MNYLLQNNKVEIAGEICEPFEYSHTTYGEKFYMSRVKIERTSGTVDYIPFMVSDRMIEISDLTGVRVHILGQYCSYNKSINGKKKLLLYVFPSEIEEQEQVVFEENFISLVGTICKQPVCRKTPLGREIADLMIAVHRSYGVSDYIPCIVWGGNAVYASTLKIGEKVEIIGRIQSREYVKKMDDETEETRIAYEVSASTIKQVKEEEE